MSKNKKFGLFLLIILILVFFYFIIKLIFPQKLANKISLVNDNFEEIKENLIPIPTVISPSGLPNKHLINMAFVPQSPEKNWDEPWQDACEEASLLTVDYFYKNIIPSTQTIKNDLLKMIDFENQQNFTYDMNLDQMSFVAQNYLGYTTKIIDNPSVEDIKKHISQNIPIIVTANGKTLYQENKHFNSGGPYYHSLTILGYDDNNQKFTVHDVGTQFGDYFKYSYTLLMNSIHDFPVSSIKEDINKGEKKILILLK